jgi:hypothetical protein
VLSPDSPRFTELQLDAMAGMTEGHYAHRQPFGDVMIVHPCGNCPAWYVDRKGVVQAGIQPPWEYVDHAAETD